MKVNPQLAIALVVSELLVGALGSGFVVAPRPTIVSESAALRIGRIQPTSAHTVQKIDGAEADGADEADAVAPGKTGISAGQAQLIAEGANPGTKTLAVEFDRENGADLFEAELDNGLDVKVDAGNGNILLTEVRDAQ